MPPTADRVAEILARVDTFKTLDDAALTAARSELKEFAAAVQAGDIPVTGDRLDMLTDRRPGERKNPGVKEPRKSCRPCA